MDNLFDSVPDYLTIPRLTGLVLSADGERLAATVQQLDGAGHRFVTSLWEIDPRGKQEARRITRSTEGEAGPAYLPDGGLLFTSSRTDTDADDDGDQATLWLLPPAGEARAVGRSPAGLSGPVTGGRTETFVVATDRLPGASVDADRTWRKARSEAKVTALIHDGFPIRHWDHELGPDFPRLLAGTVDGPLLDLTPDAGPALTEAGYDLSADGATLVTEWRVPDRRGRFHLALVAIDLATGRRSTVADVPDEDFARPAIAPDGRRVAAIHETIGGYDEPMRLDVWVCPLSGDGATQVLDVVEDLWPQSLAWSPDSATLYVTGDRAGRGAVLAVDLGSGARRWLATDAVYADLRPSPDGRYLYAIRSALDAPPAPVRLKTDATEQIPTFLAGPTGPLELPGQLSYVTATAPDGASVQGWLVTPTDVDGPAPLQVWVHGGPIMAYGGWNWRRAPWLEAAHGWAVLLPNPALSTGFGQKWIERAWPHRAALVWRDVEALLDAVVARDDVDPERTAALGGSFGGYLTNWIAGHTDRFQAIATHSGLWAADQQHATTDAAWWKTALFGRPEDHPDWYAENSPHHFVQNITTPMLLSHGNIDYRVPYSEALREWWDLVSHFDGDPADLPHRFLQFTDEGHWILRPHHYRIWVETQRAFLDWHVLGRRWNPPELT